MLLFALFFSCSKGENGNLLSSEDVFFMVHENTPVEVNTKALAVESEVTLRNSGFKVSAVKGAEGADEKIDWFDNADFIFKADEEVFSGGKRWPSYDPHFRFYASNADLSYNADGATVEARNTQDVVCAYQNSPTYEAVNPLSFEHIFALVAGMSLKWEPGYVLSDILITFQPGTGGTYNLRTGCGITDGSAGWSSLITPTEATTMFLYPDPGAIPAQANPYNPEVSTPVMTNTLDLLLVPGEYEITATWTAALREDELQHKKTYTSQKSTWLLAGDRYSLSATLGGDASMFVLEIERQPLMEWNASLSESAGGEWAHYNELWK